MGLFPIGLTLDDFLLFHSVSSKMVLNGASISTTSTEKRQALNLYCTLTLKISPTILKDRIDEKICSSFTKLMVPVLYVDSDSLKHLSELHSKLRF